MVRVYVSYIKPVNLLKLWITIESIVYARNDRSPHQNHDTQIVKLVADFLYSRAMVCDYMEPVFGCIGIDLYLGRDWQAYVADNRKQIATP